MMRFLAYHDYCGNYHQARMSFMELPRKSGMYGAVIVPIAPFNAPTECTSRLD
jgi:hypothetical protein